MPSVAIITGINRVAGFISSIDPAIFEGRQDILVFDDRTNPTEQAMKDLVALVPIKYLKVLGAALVEMDQSEKNAVDAEIAAADDLRIRTEAKARLSGFAVDPLVLRAFADIVKDEINVIRQWLTSYKAQVALATSLANLQARVAAFPDLPDRTLDQLKTAIENRIDSHLIDFGASQ